jgi:hypothetical protein
MENGGETYLVCFNNWEVDKEVLYMQNTGLDMFFILIGREKSVYGFANLIVITSSFSLSIQ